MAEKNVEVKLKGVRISYAHLFKPQERRNDKKELVGYNFSLNALIPKNTPEGKAMIQVIKDAMAEAKKGKWGDSPPRLPSERLCLRDGEPIDPDTQEFDENENSVPGTGVRKPLYDGYAGMFYLSANRGVSIEDWEKDRKNPLQLLGPRKTAIINGKPAFPRLKESDGMLYSGCYADVIVRIYGYDSEDNPARINASLEAVKFVRHGEAFGARQIDADSAFDEEDDEDGDDIGGPTSAAKPAAADDDFDIG